MKRFFDYWATMFGDKPESLSNEGKLAIILIWAMTIIFIIAAAVQR